MVIVTSTRLEASVQIDGRIAVRERHVSDAGDQQETQYLADAGSNLDAMLAANGRAFLAYLATRQR